MAMEATEVDMTELDDGTSPELDDGTTPQLVQPGKKRRPLANTYAAKKTVAQGMMDVALITSNANQLKFVLSLGNKDFFYYVVIALIVFSLILQVAVGVSLIFKGRHDLKGESKLEYANRINNYVVVGVFLITIVNVFIAAFSDASPRQPDRSVA